MFLTCNNFVNAELTRLEKYHLIVLLMGARGSKPSQRLVYAFSNEHFYTTPEYKYTIRHPQAKVQFSGFASEYDQARWLLETYDMPHVNADLVVSVSDFEHIHELIPRADGILHVRLTRDRKTNIAVAFSKHHMYQQSQSQSRNGPCHADFWTFTNGFSLADHPVYKSLRKNCNPTHKLAIRYVMLHSHYRAMFFKH